MEAMRIRCACGAPLTVEMIVPSEVWEQIAGGDYALCPMCMDERMEAKGLKCEGAAFFRGRALTTRVSPELQAALYAMRPAQLEVDRGSVGNPLLYGWTE